MGNVKVSLEKRLLDLRTGHSAIVTKSFRSSRRSSGGRCSDTDIVGAGNVPPASKRNFSSYPEVLGMSRENFLRKMEQ